MPKGKADWEIFKKNIYINEENIISEDFFYYL